MTHSIIQLLNDYREGNKTPLDVVTQQLAAIAQSDVNAYIAVFESSALEAAKESVERYKNGTPRLLEGVPISLKDIIGDQNGPTTLGAPIPPEPRIDQDATVTSRLRSAGAILLGKNNMHQFAYGATGDISHAGPALNPHNKACITGGSSSGSAAALAAHLAYGAVGTDTSASIRLPAALCGVVGMKATYDLVPTEGVFPLSKTLDHTGPMTRTVEDNALLLSVLTGREPYCYQHKINQSIQGKTVFVETGFYQRMLEENVQQYLEKAIAYLKENGAIIKMAEIPEVQAIYDAQQCVLRSEAYAIHQERLNNDYPFHPEVKSRALQGASLLAADYLQSLYFKPKAKAAFDRVLQDADIILSATCAISSAPLFQRSRQFKGEETSIYPLLARLTAPTNLSGHPSISVPVGRCQQGMPIGLQITGKYYDEATVYQYAAILEKLY